MQDDQATHAEDAVEVVVLTTHIDDMLGEDLAYLMDALMAAGALDVSVASILMKKGRPGHALTCICRPSREGELTALLFSQSSTLGVRRCLQTRSVAQRAAMVFSSTLGPVRIKVSAREAKPEFDDLAAIAARTGERLSALRQRVLEELHAGTVASSLSQRDHGEDGEEHG